MRDIISIRSTEHFQTDYLAMLPPRSHPTVHFAKTFSSLILLMIGCLSSATLSAQEIEFETKDGKYKARGTILSFVDDKGNAIALPTSLPPGTEVMFKELDGNTAQKFQYSQFTKTTQSAIKNHIVNARKAAAKPKPTVDGVSEFFVKHRNQLNALVEQYSDLGPIDTVEDFEKEQRLKEVRKFKKEIGRAAAADWPIRLTLAYLEGEYGENKYGEMHLIAKNTKECWPAWQAAITFSLRYRENISHTIRLMDQYLVELDQVAKENANAKNKQRIQIAGHAALWLRETAAIVAESGLTSDSEVKRLKQIQISNTVKSLIKQSGIPAKDLDAADKRRQEIEKERQLAKANADQIKQLALDQQVAACNRLLEQYIQTFTRDLETHTEEFDRQSLITTDVQRYFHEADLRWETAAVLYYQLKREANVELGDDSTDEERAKRALARRRLPFLRIQMDRAFQEKIVQFNLLIAERRRLAEERLNLANFINKWKNKMILFESDYVEAINADDPLKQVYFEFTARVKDEIAKYPPMPTVVVPGKNDARLERLNGIQEQREKVKALSFLFAVDVQNFLDQLGNP